MSYMHWVIHADNLLEVICVPCTVYWTLCVVSVLLMMDGLFRGYRSLPKKSRSGSSLSPFSTSLSQLQDVTAGANGSVAEQSKISPVRGRSVKEYDEQLASLKKENFNLKLRIYLLEERMGTAFHHEDKDNIMRKNIEYQVEVQSLHAELLEKQDLLCQAVKAMELSDEEHKKDLSKRDAQILQYLGKITALEKEIESLVESNTDLQTKQDKLQDDSTQMFTETFDLQSENSKAKEEIDQLQEQIMDLVNQLSDEREHVLVLENAVRDAECLQSRCTNLETELHQKSEKLQDLLTELERNGHKLSSCNLRIRTLEDALTSAKSDLNFKNQEINSRDKTVQELTAEVESMKKVVEDGHVLCDKEQRQTENLKSAVMARDNTIADLENRLEKSKSVIRNLEAKVDSVAHENKRLYDELHTMKLQRRSKNPDSPELSRVRTLEISPRKTSPVSHANISSSTSGSSHDASKSNKNALNLETIEMLQEELQRKQNKILKMEEEHKKACKMIQTFIKHTKVLKSQLDEKQRILARKEKVLKELQGVDEESPLNNLQCVPLPSHYETTSSPSERENSVEGSDDGKTAEQLSDYHIMTLEWEKQIQGLMEMLEEREEELKKYKEKYELTTSTLQVRDNRITELENKVEELKEELKCVNKKLEEMKNEKSKMIMEKSPSWMRVTEEKDKRIEQLQSEVRKYTYNLQGIVNNELWDKNREIEKLQNRFAEKLKVKEREISQLEKDITCKDMQLKILKEKISELGVQVNLPCSLLSVKPNVRDASDTSGDYFVLKEQLSTSLEECKYLHKTIEELRQQLRNTPERDSDNKELQLKAEVSHLQEELDKSEKYRLETMSLCSLLTTRLEELAYFLDSLLKHKSVLGVLGSKQRSAIKQAIDQSLDLSKSFSISMMNEDHSLAQLSSISGLLNTSHMETNVLDVSKNTTADHFDTSLSYNSHLSQQRGDLQKTKYVITEQTEIIKVLRAQIERMKKEIEVRDMEINKQNMENSLKNDNELVKVLLDLQTKTQDTKPAEALLSPENIYQTLVAEKNCSSFHNQILDNQSESEAWSEPDRGVSQARIGLDTEVLKNTSPTSNLNRSRVYRSVEGVTSESTEDDNSPSKSRTPSKRGSEIEARHTISILQDTITVLETKLKEKENEILSLQCTIMDLDNKHQQSNITEIQKLKGEKKEVEDALKEAKGKLKLAQTQNESILSELNKVNQQKETALRNIEEMKLEVSLVKEQLESLERTLRNTAITHQKVMEENEEKWKLKLHKLEKDSELKLNEIKEATNNLKMQYDTEYIQKAEMNKHFAKMQGVYDELETLKKALKAAETSVKCKDELEMELKKKIQEMENINREKILSLKRELNEVMLQTSQTALERTKISNEKLKLEAELRKLELRENEKGKECEEKEKDFMNVKNNLRKLLSQAEQQKCSLQLKVSELETLNADLHNRLVKRQTSSTENVWSRSISTSPPKISELLANYKIVGKHSLGHRIGFTRQRSDMSGYASEDVLTDENDGVLINRSAPDGYHWFNHASLTIPIDMPESRNVANSSPDLGIESDQGRFSSLETNIATRPLLQTLELTASMNNLLSAEQIENNGEFCNVVGHKTLENENTELKKAVSKLEAGLEKTMSQLSAINQNKKQVEKAVCKQIQKTSIVLRQARANLDSGSENENKRK